MIDTNMGLFHKNYHEFLYHLGLSANYKRLLYAAYAVTLCMQQQERLLLVTKWLYPDVGQALRHKLESCGTKYPNSFCRCMGTESCPDRNSCSKTY